MLACTMYTLMAPNHTLVLGILVHFLNTNMKSETLEGYQGEDRGGPTKALRQLWVRVRDMERLKDEKKEKPESKHNGGRDL